MGTKASSVFSSLPFLRVAAFKEVVVERADWSDWSGLEAEEAEGCGINDECLRLFRQRTALALICVC